MVRARIILRCAGSIGSSPEPAPMPRAQGSAARPRTAPGSDVRDLRRAFDALYAEYDRHGFVRLHLPAVESGAATREQVLVSYLRKCHERRLSRASA